MAIKFRKSISLGKNAKINISKSGIGFSVGKKGLRYSVNSNGRNTASAGIPGTGIYYSKTNNSFSNNKPPASNYKNNHSDGNETCKKCGAVISSTDKICSNCGYSIENKSIPTILWLIIFFPIGLYYMWTKTNWKKIIKIAISSFFAFCFLVCIVAGFSEPATNPLPENPISETGITALTLLYRNDVELDLSSKIKSNENSYFYVKGNDNFKLDDIKFISENPEIATIKYNKTLLTTNVYYNIDAVSPGETVVYVQTSDGLVTSEKIKVIVIGETTTEEITTETTTTQTTEPLTQKETTTNKETITEKQTSNKKETTTKKESSTKKVTTTKSQSNKPEINSSFVLNTDTRKFHRPSCHAAKKIAAENFSQSNKSYEELIKDDYSPCGICLK